MVSMEDCLVVWEQGGLRNFCTGSCKIGTFAELDEIVGDTAEVFLNKVLLDGFEQSICSRMQKHLMIPLKGVLLKGLRDYIFFGVKDERMRSRPRIMSYAFLDGFGILSILKECLKLRLGAAIHVLQLCDLRKCLMPAMWHICARAFR